jgi:hypothetical protein
MYKKEFYLNCDCGHLGHTLRITVFEDEEWPNEVFFDMLAPKLPFWKRLKYLFGFYDYQYCETTVSANSVKIEELIRFLEDVQTHNPRLAKLMQTKAPWEIGDGCK